MKKNCIILLLLLTGLMLRQDLVAQKIDLSFPEYANKNYTFLLNEGIKRDTIKQSSFDSAGNASITIPEKQKGYVGIGLLNIEVKDFLFFVVNNESYSAVKKNDTVLISGSKDNEYFYSVIQEEKPETPAPPEFFSSFFLQTADYMRQQNFALDGGATDMEIDSLRNYITETLDMEKLYTSWLWFFVIDNFVKMTDNQQVLGNDMVRILKRTNSPKVFESLAEDFVNITQQYELEDAYNIVIPYLKESGRIKNPQGQIFEAFMATKLTKGMTAPPLEGYEKDKELSDPNKTLVIFYDPKCQNCEVQLEILIKDYQKLARHKIQVVSVCSTELKSEHDNDLQRLPWSNRLCDFKGIAGTNFMNYGVLATPTIFLLDKDNKVLGKFATLSSIKNLYE